MQCNYNGVSYIHYNCNSVSHKFIVTMYQKYIVIVTLFHIVILTTYLVIALQLQEHIIQVQCNCNTLSHKYIINVTLWRLCVTSCHVSLSLCDRQSCCRCCFQVILHLTPSYSLPMMLHILLNWKDISIYTPVWVCESIQESVFDRSKCSVYVWYTSVWRLSNLQADAAFHVEIGCTSKLWGMFKNERIIVKTRLAWYPKDRPHILAALYAINTPILGYIGLRSSSPKDKNRILCCNWL